MESIGKTGAARSVIDLATRMEDGGEGGGSGGWMGGARGDRVGAGAQRCDKQCAAGSWAGRLARHRTAEVAATPARSQPGAASAG